MKFYFTYELFKFKNLVLKKTWSKWWKSQEMPIKLRHESGAKKGYFSHLSMCVEAKAFKIKHMN